MDHNYLRDGFYARNKGEEIPSNLSVQFLLRIEDTDQSRSEDEYTKQLQQDLLWLGMAWQEGPENQASKLEAVSKDQ